MHPMHFPQSDMLTSQWPAAQAGLHYAHEREVDGVIPS